eukprot:CAMPEP_0174252980 /NCGR_PEP_ID=MMETSP0439-20130205/2375_1 /TAXON_ID=0 /ORGANISM="Stereomyxa ramosa, Strain Chinc5" /LENGTH=414 /DNA_ID=CAMNT_0015333753 /DNA_START=174 /DNA_END=1418 /DNA_ORIENTATION=-
MEIGLMITFNMASCTPQCTGNGYCIGVGGCGGAVPSVSTFDPVKLNTETWMEAATAIGAKYSVLVAQHCSGFSMYPTQEFVYKETGFNYTYSVEHTPWGNGKRDVIQEFIDSCKKYNVAPGFYYSLNENYWLNVGLGKVQNSTLQPGQLNITQELYEKIAIAQQTLLWTKYGALTELWYDGGEWAQLVKLAQKLQPHAVKFNGISGDNCIRWIGTESGMPAYPVWSTNSQIGKAGTGDANGCYWNPAESDTTTTQHDRWFWHPDNIPRTLETMQEVYHDTVGQNSNLLLNLAPNSTGQVTEVDMALYKQFGEWIQSCYGKSLASTSANAFEVVLNFSQSTKVDRLMMQEDESKGQLVRQYSIYDHNSNLIANGTSIGHKRIQLLSNNITTTSLTLKLTAIGTPHISNFAAFYCP